VIDKLAELAKAKVSIDEFTGIDR